MSCSESSRPRRAADALDQGGPARVAALLSDFTAYAEACDADGSKEVAALGPTLADKLWQGEGGEPGKGSASPHRRSGR